MDHDQTDYETIPRHVWIWGQYVDESLWQRDRQNVTVMIRQYVITSGLCWRFMYIWMALCRPRRNTDSSLGHHEEYSTASVVVFMPLDEVLSGR